MKEGHGLFTLWCLFSRLTIFLIACRFEYLWADGTNVKKPIKCTAPKYIDYLMTWVQEQLDDETLFPSKIGKFLLTTFLCVPRDLDESEKI